MSCLKTADCLISCVIQGVVEVDGSTCSGSGDLEDWEDGAVIEEVTNRNYLPLTSLWLCRLTMQMNGQQKGHQE